MYHQNHYLLWSDRPVCRHSLRRRCGGLGYDCCGQQENEDSSASWMHEQPTVCYYAGETDLTHEYIEIETDSCLTVADQDFEEVHIGQELEDHEVWLEQTHQTDYDQEHIHGVSSCPPTNHRMNEGSEQNKGCLCPYRTVHSRWGNEATNQCPCVSPQCFNVRNTLVVGVEVDVLEELVYEDTEIVQTQTVFDGSLENHPMNSTSCCCNQLFLQ
ncbi:uncharacterized protein LOC103031164 [Astyanax mexicanus]|uniref:uncharacterized protein LOC103031164 n=1 Tax=Astyanax mexicanus TaxID=7994 RepID=UPI000440B474|nr:uncharacterized protein LOC103031164 [Astyanax mexicanus]